MGFGGEGGGLIQKVSESVVIKVRLVSTVRPDIIHGSPQFGYCLELALLRKTYPPDLIHTQCVKINFSLLVLTLFFITYPLEELVLHPPSFSLSRNLSNDTLGLKIQTSRAVKQKKRIAIFPTCYTSSLYKIFWETLDKTFKHI